MIIINKKLNADFLTDIIVNLTFGTGVEIIFTYTKLRLLLRQGCQIVVNIYLKTN